MSNFSLSPKMRAFLDASAMSNHPLLGYRLPVSIIKRGRFSCRIKVFPEDGYDCFTGSEVSCIYQLANLFDLSVFVECLDSQVVVSVSYYSING